MLQEALDFLKLKWLDYSTMCDFMVCPRRGFWRHIVGVRTNKRQLALEFGGAVHAGLHAWYLTHAERPMLAAFSQDWPGDDPTDSKRTTECGHKILKAYARHYATEQLEVEAVEVTAAQTIFEIPFVFKCDALVRDSTGVWVLEHKTSSSFSPLTIKSTRPNPQFVGYAVGAESYFGQKVAGTIYNGLLVSKSKTGFLREYIDFEPWERELWADEVRAFIRSFPKAGGLAPLSAMSLFRRNTVMCTTYYGECPYRTLCVTEPNEEMLEKELEIGYTLDRWNPLEEDENAKVEPGLKEAKDAERK